MATLCIISYSMKFQSYKRLKATEDLNFERNFKNVSLHEYVYWDMIGLEVYVMANEDKKDFKHKCMRYVKVFMFLQNIENIKDAELVKLGLYLRLVNPLLRLKSVTQDDVIKPSEIKKLIELSDYKIDFEKH